jgi:hypothetical protein
VPPVVGALAMRGEFLTSYTPYQAEVSQGYLQAIYEWQTYVALLTGMEVANASVYDGATALAEGVIMAINATGRKAVLVSRAVHPNYRAVLRTYAAGLDVAVDELPYAADGTTDTGSLETLLADRRYAAVVVQSPNFFGAIDALGPAAAAAIRATKTLLIGVTAEALALAALATPASWGADIAVGEGQSFGNAIAYGGPHVGFIATTSRAGTPHSRAPRRAHARQRRTHGLRADAAGARAAHPPRKGDLEHLHQPGALRAGRNDLPGGAGQDRAARRRSAQPRCAPPRCAMRRPGSTVTRRASAPRRSTNSSCAYREALPRCSRRCANAASSAGSTSGASTPNSPTAS